jgi:hypothetical protein
MTSLTSSSSTTRYTFSLSTLFLLADVGHLYSRVDTFAKDSQRRSAVSAIEQSLYHHLQAQLTEYYHLVAILESQTPV